MNHKHHHPQHGLPNPSVPIFQHGQVFVPNAMDGPPQYGWTGCGMSNMMGGPPIMGSTPVMGTPMMMGAPMMGMGVPMGAPMMGATPIMGPPMGTPVIAAPIMFMPFWRRPPKWFWIPFCFVACFIVGVFTFMIIQFSKFH